MTEAEGDAVVFLDSDDESVVGVNEFRNRYRSGLCQPAASKFPLCVVHEDGHHD